MALMATNQTTFHPVEPSWDETIVPALRKRLESESRTLSRRISAISVTSVEEASTPHLASAMDSFARKRTASPAYSPQPSKVTAIPRPSLQQSRTSSDATPEVNGSPHVNGVLAKPRSRTYSQPKAFDPSSSRNRNGPAPINPVTNGSALPTPESSRSTSPLYVPRTSDSKPTRIPKVNLGRTSSSSSRGQHQPSSINTVISDSRNGQGLYSPPTPESTWTMEDTTHSNQLRSNIFTAAQQHSRLLHEPPPFLSGSGSSIDHSYDHSQDDDTMVAGRRSNDSEERPFEHWYRGEVSRNGGVGELRVGKRMEMLDIANYGHTLRKASPRTNSRAFPPPDDTSRRRKRADSATGIGDRESFCLDEERAAEATRVLDEGPPTDLDPDGESDYSLSIQRHSLTSPTLYGVVASSEIHTNHPPPLRQEIVQPTRIPAPVPRRQSSEPPRTRTPTLTQRGESEPPSLPSTSLPSQPAIPRSASQPQTQSQTQKRRAKSPATSTPASKRSKATAMSIASKRAAEEKNRRSVAYYPTPADGVDMVDAIPSWTQPIPASGNWDEVVLPVVARKRGLDGHYEQAGGNLQPPKQNRVIEPAPGTFRYDHSKYRPPASGSIPMDEFGRHADPIAEGDEGQEQRKETPSTVRTTPLPSSRVLSPPEVKSEVRRAPSENRRPLEDADHAGCCKCIIM